MAKKDEELLDLANSRLRISKHFSKEWRKQVKKWLADYNIESFDNIDFEDLANVLQVPYIFSTIESGLPSMFSTMPSIIMSQRGVRDKEFTEFAQKIWDYAVEKSRLEEYVEEAGISFLITGQSGLRWGWKTRTRTVEEQVPIPLTNSDGTPVMDENGQIAFTNKIEEREVVIEDRPMVEWYPYDKVHFSPESRFVTDDVDNSIPYIICEKALSPDAVLDRYNYDPDDGEMSLVNMTEYDSDLDEKAMEKNFVKRDVKRLDVYYYYGVLPKKYAPDKKQWDSDTIYRFTFSAKKLLTDPEIVDKKPINLIGNYGTPFDFWRFGEPKVLRQLEQDVSLGRSIIADYRDRTTTKVALPHNTEIDEEAFKSPRKFQIVRFIGNQPPQYIAPPRIPEAVMVAQAQSRDDIQMASAQLDVSRGGASSMVETATGQKIFEQATEKRIARKRKKIGKFIKALAKNILSLCAENWEAEKFAQITDHPLQYIMENQFIDKLLNLGEDYDIEIKVEDFAYNKESKKAQAIAMLRELKDHPLVNQEALVKEAIAIGFEQEDTERFLNKMLTPEQMVQAIQQLSQMKFIPPDIATMMIQSMLSQNNAAAGRMLGGSPNGQAGAGRPGTANPMDIVNKATPSADSNQISAQNQASYKQVGVPKTGDY